MADIFESTAFELIEQSFTAGYQFARRPATPSDDDAKHAFAAWLDEQASAYRDRIGDLRQTTDTHPGKHGDPHTHKGHRRR